MARRKNGNQRLRKTQASPPAGNTTAPRAGDNNVAASHERDAAADAGRRGTNAIGWGFRDLVEREGKRSGNAMVFFFAWFFRLILPSPTEKRLPPARDTYNAYCRIWRRGVGSIASSRVLPLLSYSVALLGAVGA